MSESENNKGGEFMPLQNEESDEMRAKNLEATHLESGPVGGEDYSASKTEGVLPQQDTSGTSGIGGREDESQYDRQHETQHEQREERHDERQDERREERQEERRDDQQEERREERREGDDDNKEGGDGDNERKSKPGASRENPDAIPTAGGEQLGKKHWGESKIVPDVPKTGGDEKVSSSEGQPDKQTQDNTAKNLGGGDSAGGEGEPPKQGFVDKVKDKLGVGKKE